MVITEPYLANSRGHSAWYYCSVSGVCEAKRISYHRIQLRTLRKDLTCIPRQSRSYAVAFVGFRGEAVGKLS